MNTHILSGNNHNPMLVERLCRYFNKGMKIFTTEHFQDLATKEEGLLMFLYGWNCCPVAALIFPIVSVSLEGNDTFSSILSTLNTWN